MVGQLRHDSRQHKQERPNSQGATLRNSRKPDSQGMALRNLNSQIVKA